MPVPFVTTVFSMSVIVEMASLFSMTSCVAYTGVSPLSGFDSRKCGVHSTPSFTSAP